MDKCPAWSSTAAISAASWSHNAKSSCTRSTTAVDHISDGHWCLPSGFRFLSHASMDSLWNHQCLPTF